MSQIHKKFTDAQLKRLLDRYLKKEIEHEYIQKILRHKVTHVTRIYLLLVTDNRRATRSKTHCR